MNDKEFKCLLILLMCADPWPVDDDGENHAVLEDFANEEAKRRRFVDWLDAYHNLCTSTTCKTFPTTSQWCTPSRDEPLDCVGVDLEKQSTGKADSREDRLPMYSKPGAQEE